VITIVDQQLREIRRTEVGEGGIERRDGEMHGMGEDERWPGDRRDGVRQPKSIFCAADRKVLSRSQINP
jgi:hypothetical protein